MFGWILSHREALKVPLDLLVGILTQLDKCCERCSCFLSIFYGQLS